MIKAKLIAKTMPVDDIPATDANEFIAYVARVSNPDNQANTLTAPKLIDYLARNKHWSPFEHYYLTLEIECPKDIAVQLLRHRSFTFQEFSQRYADVSKMGFTMRECRLQDKKNRQNSLETDDEGLNLWWRVVQDEVKDTTVDRYERALNMGIAKEQARALLPIGLTMSRLYVTGNVRSFIHYLSVRQDPSAQKEHRDVADVIETEINKVFDISALKPQPAQKVRPLKWDPVTDKKDDGTEEFSHWRAETLIYIYRAYQESTGKFAVRYVCKDTSADYPRDPATGFPTMELAKQWAFNHHVEKMTPWLIE